MDVALSAWKRDDGLIGQPAAENLEIDNPPESPEGTMIIQLHTLTSLPVHIPNRGADGLAKRAVFGGIERQRISYQAQQYALRHSGVLVPLESATAAGHTYRTALVGERLLLPALTSAGIADAPQWTEAVMALWRKAEKEKVAEKSTIPEAEPDADKPVKPARSPKSAKKESKDSAAPLIVGEQELRLFVAVVQACTAAGIPPSDLRGLVEKRIPKNTPEPLVQAAEAWRTARGTVGLDGALFGRMATGVAVATVDRAVRISDALTTHAMTPVTDFFLVTDDLKDRAAGEAGGSHINTREEAAGLFYRHIIIDSDQLDRNGLDPAVVVGPLVAALLTVSPIGNRAPARTVDALLEAGGQVRSLMDAFATPIAKQEEAVKRLRETAAGDYDTYGPPSAALWLTAQPTPRVTSLAAAAGQLVQSSGKSA